MDRSRRALNEDIYDLRALEAARRIGDAAVATRVIPERNHLLTVSAHHRNPINDAAVKAVIGECYLPGQSVPGRVWEAERGILIVEVDRPAFEAIAPKSSQAYVREVGLHSLMIVPLWADGKVVGTLGVARDPGNPPYDEADYEALVRLADLSDV